MHGSCRNILGYTILSIDSGKPTFVNVDACANWLGLGQELPSRIQFPTSTLGKNIEVPADRIAGPNK
jgi:hypothetical protein